MSKKNNKPTLDESEYFDEIQAQVTELMGPPPLRTTPSSENIKIDPEVPKETQNTAIEKEKTIVNKSVENSPPPESTVPKPPATISEKSNTKKELQPEQQPKVTKKSSSKKEEEPAEINNAQEIVADKTITIEQAEELSKKLENNNEDSSTDNSDSIYSTKVSSAVEDIESRESNPVPKEDRSSVSKKKKKLKISKKKIILFITLAVCITILGSLIYPKTRYFILNNLGVRSSVSFSVLDASTNFPISGAQVSIQGANFTTDENGKVSASNLKLGPTTIKIQKRSFNETSQTVTIGWGSNPISYPFTMNASGNKYSILITDWITNKGIEGVTVVSEDSRSNTNKNGVAEIVLADNAPKQLKIQSKDYREESIVLNENNKFQISLVPASPNFYISEDSGKYNLEKVDLDGKNKVTVFGGTGSENLDSMSVLPQPSSKEQLAAFVSTRNGVKNSEGYLMSDLFIVQADKKVASKVDGTQAEKIELIGWNGPKIIFIKTVSGPSASKEGRQRIIAFDTATDNTIELAKSNGFSDYFIKNDTLYFSNTGPGAKLFSIQTDGNSLKTIINKEVWALEEISESVFAANTSDKKWQKINFSNNNTEEIAGTGDEININKLKIYSPSGTRLGVLGSSSKTGSLVIKKELAKTSEYNDLVLKNKKSLSWLSNNYLLIKNSSLNSSGGVVVNVDSIELKILE